MDTLQDLPVRSRLKVKPYSGMEVHILFVPAQVTVLIPQSATTKAFLGA